MEPFVDALRYLFLGCVFAMGFGMLMFDIAQRRRRKREEIKERRLPHNP